MSQRLLASIASSLASGGAGVGGGVRDDHPTERLLRRFARGTSTRRQNRDVVAHLLRGCEPCSAIVRASVLPGWDQVAEEADEDDPLEPPP